MNKATELNNYIKSILNIDVDSIEFIIAIILKRIKKVEDNGSEWWIDYNFLYRIKTSISRLLYIRGYNEYYNRTKLSLDIVNYVLLLYKKNKWKVENR